MPSVVFVWETKREDSSEDTLSQVNQKDIDLYRLIWIGPVISQHEMEGLFQWINLHLTALNLRPLTSFSKIKTQLLFDPEEALRFEFDVVSLGHPHSIELFKEAVWSEVFAESHPTPKPYALSFLPLPTLEASKKLICFDMDSTLINQEVIDEIARVAGFYDQCSEITEAAMQGKIDFAQAFLDRIKLFKGMSKAQAESIIPSLSLSPGAEKLLSHFRFLGAKTAVVSGGFEFILKHFQKQLFLDQVYGNVLSTDADEVFTGETNGPLVDAAYKKKLVKQLKENYRAFQAETIVVGDGANDVLMMEEAGVSVSFCGKPKLAAIANTLVFNRNLLWIKSLLPLILLFFTASCTSSPVLKHTPFVETEKPFIDLPDPEPEKIFIVQPGSESVLNSFLNLLRVEENRNETGLDPRAGVEFRKFPTETAYRAVFISKSDYEFLVYRMALDSISSDGFLVVYVNHVPSPENGIWAYYSVKNGRLKNEELSFPPGLLGQPFIEMRESTRIFRFATRSFQGWVTREYEWNGKSFIQR